MGTARVSFLPLPLPPALWAMGRLQINHLLFSSFLVRVGHCRPHCTTASTRPFSFMHRPGWSWISTRSIFLQLLLPWRCFCPFPAFFRGADALLFTSFLGHIQALPVAVGPAKKGQRCFSRKGRDVLLLWEVDVLANWFSGSWGLGLGTYLCQGDGEGVL